MGDEHQRSEPTSWSAENGGQRVPFLYAVIYVVIVTTINSALLLLVWSLLIPTLRLPAFGFGHAVILMLLIDFPRGKSRFSLTPQRNLR